MVLLKCATYAPHCMHGCKQETRLNAISILRNIPQAKKGYQVLDILYLLMLNLFIKSGIIHHRESCFSSIFNVIQIIQDSSISEKEKNVLLNDFLLNCKLNTRLHRKKMCVRCMLQLEMFRSLWFRKSPDLPFPQPKINTNPSPKVKCWVMGEVGGDSPSPQFISKSLLFSYVFFQSLGIQPELSENSQKL